MQQNIPPQISRERRTRRREEKWREGKNES